MAYLIHPASMTAEDAYNARLYLSYDDMPHAIGVLKTKPLILDPETNEPIADLKITFYCDDDDRYRWHRRERDRFLSGAYTVVPWESIDTFPDHFVHLSIDAPGLVAYTENDEKGMLDRQTRLKPGKYLTRFYPEMAKADLDRYVAACATVLPTLTITRDAATIERVYTTGPKSCMSRPAHAYKGHCHPARVYADSPDLALAYVAQEDKIIARCVVWPDKKIAVRVYPDQHAIMTRLLELNGYDTSRARRDDCSGLLAGATVRAIEDDNGQGFIMGYVDGIDHCKLSDDRQWLILGQGSISTCATQSYGGDTIAAGVTEPDDDDDEENEDNDDDTFICCHCSERYPNDDHMGYGYCESCYENDCTTCAIDDCGNRWIENEEFGSADRRLRAANGQDQLCRSCARSYVVCEHCSEFVLADDGCDCQPDEDSDDSANEDNAPDITTPDTIAAISDDPRYRLDRFTAGEPIEYWKPCYMGAELAESSDRDVIVSQFAELQRLYPENRYRVVELIGQTIRSTVVATSEETCSPF